MKKLPQASACAKAALLPAILTLALLPGAARAQLDDKEKIDGKEPQSSPARSEGSEMGAFTQVQPLPRIFAPKHNAANAGTQASTSRAAEKLAAPAYTRSAFEQYVAAATGTPLEIFGRSMFRDVPSTFAPADSAPVNADYVIGSGDELQISASGMVDLLVNATVDRSGAINIPHVGVVRVAGVRYGDLQAHLARSVGRIFKNFELAVSVAQTRAVQVYVVGHAVRPGSYTVSAMSTLLNALFASGGPDGTGSLRSIQLRRGNATVVTFDLYDVLIRGDKSKDVSLRDGDVIHIPEVGPMVALMGNVKRPGIYELQARATLAEAVGWAGGLDSSAENKPVSVERIVDNVYRTVGELAATQPLAQAPFAGEPLAAGDVVRVFAPAAVPIAIQARREYVRVDGEVSHSGVVELRQGETLRQLMSRLGGPTANGYLFATRLVRGSVRVSQQARLNEAAQRFEQEVEATASRRLASTTDKDAAVAIAADVERQRRLAQRLREVKAEGRIVLELAGSNARVEDLPELPLQDGDAITVPRKPGTVDVLGAVFQQNAIVYRDHRKVGDYVTLAGGETANAEKSEMYLIRADGTAKSGRNAGWVGGLANVDVNPGDAIIVPEKIQRGSWTQAFKEWTTIFYQFGLGAAGLKVLKD